jgi:hypothetical protein
LAEEKLTMEEVNEQLQLVETILGFSSGYSQAMKAYTPEMVNSVLKNINLNPITPDRTKIDTALADTKNHETELIGYNQSFYVTSMIFKRNADYISNLPAFNLSIQPINPDYKDSKFKKDLKTVEDFLNKFDYRTEFKKALFNMLQQEFYPCIFRNDGSDKYVLQDFPFAYTKITGRFEYGLLWDADMSYFIQPSVDIDLYPSFFKRKYNELFSGNTNGKYIPSSEINHRTGKWALWVQTSPEGKYGQTWGFKFRPELATNIPYFAPIMSDVAILPTLRNLQVNQSMVAARKIIASSIPYLKEATSGNTQNRLAIDPDMLGKYVGLVRKAIEEAISLVQLPTEDVRGIEFSNTDKESYDRFLKITSSLLGGGRSIFSTDKQTVSETNLSLCIDEMLATDIYSQFANFLEFYVNQLTKKYRFKFSFSGTRTYLNKEQRMKEAFDIAAPKGIVAANKLANALDMDVFELKNEMGMWEGMGFDKLLQPMLNMFTQTKDGAGAPQKSQSEISDAGAETRASGSNIEKGGDV